MKYIIYLHYFLTNLLGCYSIPHIIQINSLDYFSEVYDENGMYYATYVRFLNRKDVTEIFVVESKFKYTLYLKTIGRLWKYRKTIIFDINIS